MATGDYNGQTPLHLAVSSGDLTVLKMLIQHGADVDAQDLSRYIANHGCH